MAAIGMGGAALFPPIGLPFFLLAGWFVRRARQYRALVDRLEGLDTTTAPVLLLRDFEEDDELARRAGIVQGLMGSFNEILDLTEEEQLGEALEDFGPMVAIGRPGEKLPTLGAMRFYSPDDAWRERVVELMEAASLIVFVLGESAGVRWEIEEAMKHVEPHRLVILVPQTKDEYLRFAEDNASWFPLQLPDYQVEATRFLRRARRLNTIRGMICCTEGWKTRFVAPTKVPWRRIPNRNALIPGFKLLLQPVYELQGREWTELPLQWGRSLLLVGLALASIAGLLFVVMS